MTIPFPSSATTDLSAYAFETLGDDGQLLLLRGRRNGDRGTILAMAPVSDEPAPGILARLEHAYSVREEFDGSFVARPRELVRHAGPCMLLLDDPGGELLEAFLGRPMETAQFLRIATGIADALGRFHGQGFIHKDIKPGNILVNAATGKAWLTGLCLVSRSPRQRPEPEPPEMIAGTLAYMAPEQTGRMNRSMDSRSDLYALGVTLYEMLTETLPFTASDPMEWVHCHIAKEATPPSERSPEIPAAISDIVMKLLAKVPEERYQTAAGVGADLRICLESLESRGRIEPFPLGARDISDRLLIPETLYGREREIEILLAAFDRVVVRGTAELVLVSGYSGVGKSSVVNELHKVLVPPRGLFASGKFDQYKRDIPYATLAQAFQTLLRQILGKSEAEVARWREALQEAIGINGQLIINLIPEVELIIGKQRPVRGLPPQEEESRFQTLLRRFIGVFARPEHPLALFLDDLQWLDAATLDLLRTLVTHDEARHLLVIGAYRDNEVGTSHQLLRVLEEIGETGAPVHRIALEGLGLNDVAQLVADTVHRERKDAYPLAQLVHDKTGGNPFFVIQFVATLEDENLLVLVPGATAWAWNLDRIRAKGFTENVVDLMVAKLRRFSAAAQNAMKQLACLGDSAPVSTLVMVYGESKETLHAALWEAVRPGLVSRSEDTYSFAHDRVQEAAYALIPEAERAATHLHIGRALAARMEAAEIEEKIFEIVSQFNRGAALITSREERKRVAGLNLMAGRRARSSTAYASALVYLASGIALLDEENFEESDSLDFALRLQQAECELLSANFASAGRLIAELLKRSKTKVDTAAAYRLKIELHLIQSENQAAVGSALECLRLFGIEMTSHPARAELDSVLEDVWRKLDGRAVEELVDLSPVTDPEIVAALEVLCVLYAPAFFTDEILTSLHICHTIRLALEHGMTGASAHAFGLFGIMLGHFYGRYEEGYRFAELARELGKRHCLFACEAKILKALEEASVWTRPMTFSIDTIRAAFRSATESGDIPVACYACNHTVTDLLVRGDHLDSVWSETESGLAFVQAANYRDVTDVLVYQQRFVQNMRGRTTATSTFNGDGFEQLRFEERLTPDRNQTTVCWYWIIKAKARFLFGDFEEARQALERARPILWATHGRIQFFEYHFFSALTLAALAPSPSSAECLEQIGMHRELLARWAGSCPATFADKHLLVMAETARLEGRDSDAGHLYDDAIRHARENGFIQNEAIANEAAARFYAARDFETIAHAYLRNARFCYLRWGASGKVRQLDRDHPRLREESTSSPLTATIGAPVEQMDLATVIKVSQAVSSEIFLETLIDKLMAIAVEHAGAVRGLLLLSRGDELRIEAEAVTVRDSIEVSFRGAPVTAADLPQSILRYVHRTQESVLLDDATVKNPFSDDPYIRSNRSRSILCLPLVKQTQLVGVLYFENHQSSHAFTPGRIAILNLLASQAAISLENALLYADLLDAKAHLRASERELRQASDSIPSLAWSALADGSNETFNKPWHDYTGISPENALNGGWTASYHPDDLDRVLEKWTEILVSGADGEVEARLRRFDGEYRSFLVRGKALRDESGAITRWYGTCTDIEDRKQAEKALERSKVYLEHAQQLSHTGSVSLRASDGQIFWSEETARIYGYDPAIPPTMEMVLERVHPEDVELLRDTFARAMQGGASFDFEHRLLMPDGTIKYLRNFAHAVKDKEGREEVLGAVMDITDRKRVEEDLRRSEVLFAQAQRLTRTSSLRWKVSTGEIIWTDESYRLMEYPRSSTPTVQMILDRCHPDDLAFVQKMVGRSAQFGTIMDFQHRLLMPNGTIKHIHVLAQNIGLKPQDYEFVGAVTDITEHVEAKSALEHALAEVRESEERFRTIIDTIPALAWSSPADGLGDFFSQRWLDYTGLSAEEAQGAGWIVAIHPNDRGILAETWTKLRVEGKEGGLEARLRRFDGEYRWFLFRAAPWIDQSGDVVKWYGTNTDIEDRKQAEFELRRREAELRKAQSELAHVSRLTTMGELTASIAHEVNQPLTGIVMGGNAGLRWLDGDPPNLDEAREAIQRVVQEGKRAGAVISRIRQLFKKDDPIKEPLDINEVIEEVVVLTRNELQRHNIAQQLHLAADLPPVLGDRVQIQQVLMNLILNAIEAMNAVEVGLRELSIRTIEADNDQVCIEVRDSGVGVDPKDAERIFETFHTTKSGGMGMGLAICRSIVQSHGGRLQVVPQKGPGATFQFTLATRD